MKIKCPSCQKVLNIPPEAAGKVVKCPCGKQLRAPAAPADPSPAPTPAAQTAADQNPFDDFPAPSSPATGFQPQAPQTPNPYASAPQAATSLRPAGSHGAAAAKVKPAAITLLIIISISMVLVVLDLLFRLLLGGALMAGGAGNIAPEDEFAMMISGVGGIIVGFIMLICGGIIIAGTIKMMKLQSYGLAMTACILSMIPILSPCCCLGLPIGIWGIVVLMDPNVKAAFT